MSENLQFVTFNRISGKLQFARLVKCYCLCDCFHASNRYKANGVISIRHRKGVLQNQIPVAARFEYADLHNASSGCDKTNIQLFFPNVLHNVTNALGHITNITNECSSTK